MKGVPPSLGLAIKKHQSFFQTLVQTFLCTAYLLLWESQKRRLEPNILTWCCAAYCRSPFPQSLPRFFRVTGAFAPNGKNIRTFTVPFLRRGFSPRSSVLCAMRKAVFRNMPIFTCKLIMNLLSDFVNRFTQIWQKRKYDRLF